MKVIARNKRATFDYALNERLLAGIVLKGHEVKSVRSGDVSLAGAFASLRDNELWVNNMHIGPYKQANLKDYEPTTSRKLLVHKNEFARLQAAKQNGQHIVPTAIGISGRFIKLEVGVGPSQKRHDKRSKIQTKDQNIDAQRELRGRY